MSGRGTRELKSGGFVEVLNREHGERHLLYRADTEQAEKPGRPLSKLTVVTEQQACLPVFIHVDGCYEIYLQARENVRKDGQLIATY